MDFSFSEEQTLLQESIERFIRNDYAGLTLPVALIYGAQSRLFTEMTREHLESLIPGEIRSMVIENARHHLFLDQPPVFVDALRELCGTLAQDG